MPSITHWPATDPWRLPAQYLAAIKERAAPADAPLQHAPGAFTTDRAKAACGTLRKLVAVEAEVSLSGKLSAEKTGQD